MSFFRSSIIAAVFLVSIKLAVCAEQVKPKAAPADATADVWLPVDESDWAVYMDAPAYHFELAKEFLQKGDISKAAAELNRGNTFLILQRNRITFAEKQVEKLSSGILSGKTKDVSKLDSVTATALKVINEKYAMLPVEIEGNAAFEDAYNYHFDKARTQLQGGNLAGAASEIRKAAAFLRLKAANTGNVAKADLDSAGVRLKQLAVGIESGTVTGIKELNAAFKEAAGFVSKKKD